MRFIMTSMLVGAAMSAGCANAEMDGFHGPHGPHGGAAGYGYGLTYAYEQPQQFGYGAAYGSAYGAKGVATAPLNKVEAVPIVQTVPVLEAFPVFYGAGAGHSKKNGPLGALGGPGGPLGGPLIAEDIEEIEQGKKGMPTLTAPAMWGEQLPTQVLPMQIEYAPALQAKPLVHSAHSKDHFIVPQLSETLTVQPILESQTIMRPHLIEQQVVRPIITANTHGKIQDTQPIVRQNTLKQPIVQQHIQDTYQLQQQHIDKPETQPVRELGITPGTVLPTMYEQGQKSMAEPVIEAAAAPSNKAEATPVAAVRGQKAGF